MHFRGAGTTYSCSKRCPSLAWLTSTRNSGVIHSGIYYPPGSLKARLCVRGNQLAYEFCAAHGVPHRNIGKIVVASSQEEVKDLTALMQNGCANGVEGLHIVDRAAIRAREPHVEGFCALEVPSTGILSSEDFVKTFARLATANGAHIVDHAKVERLEASPDSIRVTSAAGEIEARCLINSAGLFADEVAAMLGSSMARHKIYPVRGEYCELVRAKQDWVRGLVYPLPHARRIEPRHASHENVMGQRARSVPPRAISTTRTTTNAIANRWNISPSSAKLLFPDIEVSDLTFPPIRESGPN